LRDAQDGGKKMRLICPNCGAQYEVSEDVIPETGRDVQCSNCGHTWFQVHPSQDVDLANELGETLPIEPEVWDNTPAPDYDDLEPLDDVTLGSAPDDWYVEPELHEPSIEADNTAISDAVKDALEAEDAPSASVQDDGDLIDGPIPDTPTVPPRREIDPDIASILRSEADYETQARQSDASSLETQSDLGLVEEDTAATKREAEIRERMADIQGVDSSEDAPRRELLPDIEEINSSLSERTPEANSTLTDLDYEVRHRRGFRSGFFLVTALVLFTILLYAYGPQIVETIPQAAGMIEDFTTYVDKSRVWLDDALQNFIAKVSAI